MVFSKEKLNELEARVKASPGSPSFARLADHYRSQGHVDAAITLCEKGVSENPSYPTGHLLLGRCYYEKERVDEAIAEFEAVLKLDRKNLFALKIMGDISAQKGQNIQAAQFYKRALDYDPLNATIQDMFRRFERYYRESGVQAAPSESPDVHPSAPHILEEVPAAAVRENTRAMLATDLPTAPQPSEHGAEPQSVSFDDLDAVVAESAAPQPQPAPQAEPESDAALLEPKPEPSKPSEPAETISLEQELGLDSPDVSIPAEEISEAEAVRIAEEAQGAAGVVPLPAEEDLPDLPEPALKSSAPTAQPPQPKPAPQPIPESSAVVTEMVDLPPEMTGVPREERVGDFKARKSIVDRLMEEQTGLLETVSTSPSSAPQEEVLPVEEEVETPAISDEAIPEEEAIEAPSPELPKAKPSEPAVDGFYSVTGDTSTGEGLQSDSLADIDNVEMAETIDESMLEESDAEPLPEETPQDQAVLDEWVEPGTGVSAEQSDEIETPEPAVPSPIQETEIPAEEPAAAAPSEETGDELQALLGEIDADDSVKNFVAAVSEEKPAEQPAQEIPQAQELPDDPPIVPEEPETSEPEPSGQEQNSGPDGFYSVTGDSASTDATEALSGIDEVELQGVVDEEAPQPETDSALPESSDEPTNETAMVSDVEELLVSPDDSLNNPAPEPQKPETQPASVSDSKPESTTEETPIAQPAAPKPRKKTDKTKSKTPSTTKVVSNVATTSLADIYLRQGHKEQALAVYKKILEQNPDNKRIQTKIEKLEKEIEEAEAE